MLKFLIITSLNYPNGLIVMLRDQVLSEKHSVGERGLKYLGHRIVVYTSAYLEQFSWLCVCIMIRMRPRGFYSTIFA